MSSTYLATLAVGRNEAALGNTLFGVCNTYSRIADKEVTLAAFDDVEPGIQINVRFLNGSKQTSGATLRVGAAAAIPVSGPCICGSNEVLSFVYEQEGANTKYWRVVGHYVYPSDNNPEDIGVASPGTSSDYARADHTHAIDVQRVAELVEGEFVSKDIIQHTYDMFYASDEDTISALAANSTTTKKFLRSIGVQSTVEENGETVHTVVASAPEWDVVTARDVGLGNVSNHKQVTEVTYNATTGAVTVTKGDEQPVTLFTLGANAFLSTVYLPIEGGQMTGPLSFNSNASYLTWNNEHKAQRLVVTESINADNPVFVFQQENGGSYTNLFTIRANSEVVATTFIGALQGNADTASTLRHKAVTNSNIDDSQGTFAFSGNGVPWANQNWVGLQVGDNRLKFQIVENASQVVMRTHNGTSWSQWSPLLTAALITSGDTNGTIKVADTNIAVTGLGALAFEDTIPASSLPDMTDLYVTIDTDQTVTGIKTFNNIMFIAPLNTEAHGMLFQGNSNSAALKYHEVDNDGHLHITMTSQSTNPIEFGWQITGIAGEQIVHSFTANEYVLTPVSTAVNTYNPITIRPGVTEHGTLGTSMYKWAQVYAVEFYGALKGNADTATKATAGANGLVIN